MANSPGISFFTALLYWLMSVSDRTASLLVIMESPNVMHSMDWRKLLDEIRFVCNVT